MMISDSLKLIFILLALQLIACKTPAPTVTTNGIPGTYIKHYPNGEVGGALYIHPYSDSEVLIYLEVNRGAPSYNSGSLYTTIKWGENGAILEDYEDGMECRLDFFKEDDRITINTIAGQCGFGYGVNAEGTYYKESDKVPEYFLNGEGSKIYFSDYLHSAN